MQGTGVVRCSGVWSAAGSVRRWLGGEVRLERGRGAVASWHAQGLLAREIGATGARCAVRCGLSGELSCGGGWAGWCGGDGARWRCGAWAGSPSHLKVGYAGVREGYGAGVAAAGPCCVRGSGSHRYRVRAVLSRSPRPGRRRRSTSRKQFQPPRGGNFPLPASPRQLSWKAEHLRVITLRR